MQSSTAGPFRAKQYSWLRERADHGKRGWREGPVGQADGRQRTGRHAVGSERAAGSFRSSCFCKRRPASRVRTIKKMSQLHRSGRESSVPRHEERAMCKGRRRRHSWLLQPRTCQLAPRARHSRRPRRLHLPPWQGTPGSPPPGPHCRRRLRKKASRAGARSRPAGGPAQQGAQGGDQGAGKCTAQKTSGLLADGLRVAERSGVGRAEGSRR